MVIGVVSDTHGLLRPELLPALAGVEHILHCGDVGDAGILDELRGLAPVTAVRGNIDTHGACAQLPATEIAELGGRAFYLLHSIDELDLKPEAAGFAAVLFGHSHQPLVEMRRGVLYLNPGSAGPKRFSLPIACARLTLAEDGSLSAEIVNLLK